MPYELSWEAEGLLRCYTGLLTAQDRMDSFEAISAHPRFDELRYTITDYRGISGYVADPVASAELAAMHKGPLLTNPRLVIAAVTTHPGVIADIRAFIAQGLLKVPYRIFPDMESARRWVGAVGEDLSGSRAHRPA